MRPAGAGLTSKRPVIAVLATLDTKEEEVQFLCSEVETQGFAVSLVDLSLRTSTTRRRVSRSPATSPRPHSTHEPPQLPLASVIERMGRDAKELLRRRQEAGALDAVLAIGGGKGTVIACMAMNELPYALPKVMVSSARPDVFGRVTGTNNILIFPAVVDLNGLNDYTRILLRQAAHAVSAMVRVDANFGSTNTVAITAFGVTTPAVTACRRLLAVTGVESVIFAATGAGGLALERFVRQGIFKVVLDLTTTELADYLLGGFGSAGATRLEAAGEVGLPQIIAPGAMDMVNFGPISTVPLRYRRRNLYQHSPQTTLMRTTPAENKRLGALVGDKLRRANGPAIVLVPLRGFSAYDVEGGPFWDPAATDAWVSGLQRSLKRTRVSCELLDCHINDLAFATRTAERAQDYLGN